MFMGLLNRVLEFIGVRQKVSEEPKPKDPLDAMLVGRKVPTEKRDWN
ncbi:hypothetical protein WMF38_56825 [Sorangium sp. So ce118]